MNFWVYNNLQKFRKKTEFVAWKPSNRFIKSRDRKVSLKPNDFFFCSAVLKTCPTTFPSTLTPDVCPPNPLPPHTHTYTFSNFSIHSHATANRQSPLFHQNNLKDSFAGQLIYTSLNISLIGWTGMNTNNLLIVGGGLHKINIFLLFSPRSSHI